MLNKMEQKSLVIVIGGIALLIIGIAGSWASGSVWEGNETFGNALLNLDLVLQSQAQ